MRQFSEACGAAMIVEKKVFDSLHSRPCAPLTEYLANVRVWHEPAERRCLHHGSFRRDNGHATDIAGRPNLTDPVEKGLVNINES
jgi:hypothetical protein